MLDGIQGFAQDRLLVLAFLAKILVSAIVKILLLIWLILTCDNVVGILNDPIP